MFMIVTMLVRMPVVRVFPVLIFMLIQMFKFIQMFMLVTATFFLIFVTFFHFISTVNIFFHRIPHFFHLAVPLSKLRVAMYGVPLSLQPPHFGRPLRSLPSFRWPPSVPLPALTGFEPDYSSSLFSNMCSIPNSIIFETCSSASE